MKPLDPKLEVTLREALEKWGYRFAVKPALDTDEDYVAYIEKQGSKYLHSIYTTRSKSKLIDAVNIITRVMSIHDYPKEREQYV